MFTGIIQSLGRVAAVVPGSGDVRIRIDVSGLDASAIRNGDSVAVSGVCLTIASIAKREIAVDVSTETLSRTAFGELQVGDDLNLELALTPQTPMGGHFVTGHVDGIASLAERYDDGRSVRMSFTAPRDLAGYLAEKGAVTVDGVSLTVNSVRDAQHDVTFAVNIIPHTLHATTFRQFEVGRRVHVEVDMIARYLKRLVETGTGSSDR
ncbi:MAG: riboflavin synthase [Gammaproteobacteria bacterium]|nr:riboflavin synthase [Gammaproteobacteria bacterium]MDH3466315.1 riboflavin synthase [Gammaproteobacteria bacterium]